jgi:hypothetical protein
MRSTLTDAPKLFHSYVRRKKVGAPSVGPIRQNCGLIVDDPAILCEVFANSFSSAFVLDVPASPVQCISVGVRVDDLAFEVGEVYDLLRKLDASSAMGPDMIHPQLLKSCASALAVPLHYIFEKSLSVGVLPRVWLQSLVVPLFKAKSRYQCDNYRPVSLTSVCCKTMERLLCSHLTHYLESNSLLSVQQFGFRKGKSTEDQLLLSYADVVCGWEKHEIVDMVFLDFSKAFDRVNHSVLLQRLSNFGIVGPVLSWISAFLSGRTFQVCVDGELSLSRPVLSGVPQGSVLGPLLFLLYVDPLIALMTCSVKVFADDFKLYLSYSGHFNQDGRSLLQRNLDVIADVANSWNLILNREKCVVMRFCRSGNVPDYYLCPYTLGDSVLRLVDCHRDLGVVVSDTLKFHLHIKHLVRNAAGLAGNLLRSTVCRSPDFMVALFIMHVRPLLDYCSVVWNTGYVGDLRLLESVQRRWTRHVDGLQGLEYGERLRRLNLFSIMGRLLRADLIKCWKVLSGQGECAEMSALFCLAGHGVTRGHPLKLIRPCFGTDVGGRSFPSRCVRLWNSLPEEVVLSESLGSFKSGLARYLGDVLYEYV